MGTTESCWFCIWWEYKVTVDQEGQQSRRKARHKAGGRESEGNCKPWRQTGSHLCLLWFLQWCAKKAEALHLAHSLKKLWSRSNGIWGSLQFQLLPHTIFCKTEDQWQYMWATGHWPLHKPSENNVCFFTITLQISHKCHLWSNLT